MNANFIGWALTPPAGSPDRRVGLAGGYVIMGKFLNDSEWRYTVENLTTHEAAHLYVVMMTEKYERQGYEVRLTPRISSMPISVDVLEDAVGRVSQNANLDMRFYDLFHFGEVLA